MNDQIFFVTCVFFRRVNGQLGLDEQTCRSLVRWAENFDRIVFAGAVLPEAMSFESSETWQAISDLPCANRLEIIPLPYAYKPWNFIRHYRATRRLIRQKIQESKYLCFGNAVLIGDWAVVACHEAISMNRPYATWIDRIEYQIIGRTLNQLPLKRRLYLSVILPLIKLSQQYLVRRSHLGLFQGHDVYTHYQNVCPQPQCIQHAMIQRSDWIPTEQLNQKVEQTLLGEPLYVCYAGRAAAMKSPLDWVRAIHQAVVAGVNLKATWLGDGPMLAETIALATHLGIIDKIEFPGFVSNPTEILNHLRKSHMMLFCHTTPESPRCLIEALVSGCPIVGYDSPYPRGLTEQFGGGQFVPLNHWQALGDQIIQLNADRQKLAYLIGAAGRSGQCFDEEELFRHRSALIKKYLGPEFNDPFPRQPLLTSA